MWFISVQLLLFNKNTHEIILRPRCSHTYDLTNFHTKITTPHAISLIHHSRQQKKMHKENSAQIRDPKITTVTQNFHLATSIPSVYPLACDTQIRRKYVICRVNFVKINHGKLTRNFNVKNVNRIISNTSN